MRFCINFFYSFDYTKFINSETLGAIGNSSSVAANKYIGLGMAAIIPAFLENFIANGVSEEILFRSFLCKRLCNKFGDIKGVIMQAILSGLMHNVLFIISGINAGIAYHLLLLAFTGTGALLLGYLNERIFNGSIIPSVVLHGLGNFIATLLIAFGG